MTTILENGKKEEKIERVTEEKTITTFSNNEDNENKGENQKVIFLKEESRRVENEKKDKEKRFDLFSMSSYTDDCGSLLTKIKEDSREDDEITEDNQQNDNQGLFSCSPLPSPRHSTDFPRNKEQLDEEVNIDFSKKVKKSRPENIILIAEDNHFDKDRVEMLKEKKKKIFEKIKEKSHIDLKVLKKEEKNPLSEYLAKQEVKNFKKSSSNLLKENTKENGRGISDVNIKEKLSFLNFDKKNKKKSNLKKFSSLKANLSSSRSKNPSTKKLNTDRSKSQFGKSKSPFKKNCLKVNEKKLNNPKKKKLNKTKGKLKEKISSREPSKMTTVKQLLNNLMIEEKKNQKNNKGVNLKSSKKSKKRKKANTIYSLKSLIK